MMDRFQDRGLYFLKQDSGYIIEFFNSSHIIFRQKKMFKSLIGWGYNLLKTDWNLLWKSCQSIKNKNTMFLFLDSIFSALLYETTPQEYFYFEFYNKNSNERAKWAGQTAMWKAQRGYVKPNIIPSFSSKEKFSSIYRDLMIGQSYTFNLPEKLDDLISFINKNKERDFFIKPENGQCGVGAFKLENNCNISNRVKLLKDKLKNSTGKYIIEPLITNHEVLRRVNPSSLNTVRIVTRLDDQNNVEILFARVRFGVGKDVDNLGSGGLAAPVDPKTGKIIDEAVSTLNGKTTYVATHPLSAIVFKDYQLPNWNRVIQVVEKAALIQPDAKIIGWDIAITPEDIYIIEGNHNWCKLLWQLPVKQGLKYQLEKF